MSVNIYFVHCGTNLVRILRIIFVILMINLSLHIPKEVFAYEFAHYVMDARTGKFLYGKNFKTKLNPASLTKMMTLYLTFNELKKNRIGLDQLVTISANAAREPSSKLWLSAGQRVSVRTLIRGAAIRSANDAATALAEHISGSEAKFADYMTLAAREMGMSKTVFKNAHGLTASAHLSTPRDMAILARRLIFDFPEYYNIFGRNSVQVLGKNLYNTNRRFLGAYPGSDGIKTGFTSAAGYNLAASATRRGVRIIGVIFGSGSAVLRAKRMAELLDLGFARAPKVSKFVPLFQINLRSDMINQIGKNSLLYFSEIPLSRPKSFSSYSHADQSVELDKIEELLKEVESSLLKEPRQENISSEESFSIMNGRNIDVPPSRPKTLQEDQKTGDLVTENGESKLMKNKPKMEILVGFYYNRYNAEKDLPTILLSDSSLLENVTADISREIFRNKAGFRIKISPLSFPDASRACAKIIATGELCDVRE